MALTYEDVLNQQAQGQKNTALQQKTAADLEIERQAKQLQGDVNTQKGNISAVGLLGQENKRIVDQIQGYGGSGAGVQHQDIIASGTQSRLGQVDNAYATSLGDFANKRVDNTTAYNNNLSTIDSNIAQAKATYFYEQQQAEIAAAKAKAIQDTANYNADVKARATARTGSIEADAKAYANSIKGKYVKDGGTLKAPTKVPDPDALYSALNQRANQLKQQGFSDSEVNDWLNSASTVTNTYDIYSNPTVAPTAEETNWNAQYKADAYTKINSMVSIYSKSTAWDSNAKANYRARIKTELDNLYSGTLSAQDQANYDELKAHYTPWTKL